MKPVVYLDYIGGRWESFYWHTDEQRYFRFHSHLKGNALRKACEHMGYKLEKCNVVIVTGAKI